MAGNPALTIVWRLENTNMQAKYLSDCYETGRHMTPALKKTVWQLKIYFSWENDSDPINFRLCRSTAVNKCAIPVIYEFSFLTAGGIPHVICTSTVNSEDGGSYEIKNCPTQEEVFVTKRSTFLPDDTLTVRCRLWNPDGGVEQPVHRFEITRICLKKHKILFSLPEFSKLQPDEQKTVGIYSGFEEDYNLHTLELSLRKTNAKKVVVAVKVEEIISASFPVLCTLSVVNRFGKLVMSQKSRNCFESGKNIWNFSTFIHMLHLQNKNDYLPKDTLTLHCEFSTPYRCQFSSEKTNYDPGTMDTHIPYCVANALESQLVENVHHTIALQDDLQTVYKDSSFSDFELHAGGSSFPVHKMVLAARSPVFKALINSDMKEAASGAHHIPDLAADTLDRMLLFIYTDTVSDLQWESAAKLYYAADKYQVLPLKEKCSSYLKDNIDGSNVCRILELADRHNDEGLRLSVSGFLANHTAKILSSPEWEKFMSRNVKLAASTLRTIFEGK